MKMNLNGVSKNLRIGKGVLLNSTSQSLLSIINLSTNNYADININTLITNNINANSLYSDSVGTMFYTQSKFNDGIYLLSGYTHVGYVETSVDTAALNITLNETNISDINTLTFDVYDSGSLDSTYTYNMKVSTSNELVNKLNSIFLNLNLDYEVSYNNDILTLEHNSSKYIRNIYFDHNNYAEIDVNHAQNAFELSYPIYNLSLTGNPTAPTQNASDNSTKIATTAFVQNTIGNINTILDTINGVSA